MADPGRGVLVIDPHGDLARALLGLVPRHRQADVVSLDLADAERPVGLNPLDATTGRPPDRIVADAISGLRRLWPTPGATAWSRCCARRSSPSPSATATSRPTSSSRC